MSVVETYRVVTGTTRALLYFERTDEVCEVVAEMIVDRRLRAGLRSPPGAVRRIAMALRDGVKFVEDERGLVVPESSLVRAPAGPLSSAQAPVERGRPRKKPMKKKRKR